jgi:ectonucleotide pyrophosphatase/phosphodiesterase family member 5
MSRRFEHWLMGLACVFAASLSAIGAWAAPQVRPPLILVSIDGFRADYLDRGVSPNLTSLAAGGVRAERLIPSFPSITFPNHYTLVTGLYPDHHGIVNNSFQDPKLPGVFKMASKEEAWWDEATPIWVTAERQGLATATMFWPGSEAVIHGVRPQHWEPFNAAVPGDARVDKVLGWLDLPVDQRPRFITLYFNLVDTNGHLFGPDTPQVNMAIARTDASIGRLLEGLKTRGISADLIVLADHGMAAVSSERTILLDDIIDVSAVHVVFDDAVLGVDIAATPAGAAARAKLLAPHDHMACWNKADVPPRYHYGTNPRVPEVICAAEVGWLIQTRAEQSRPHFPLRGEHGYDNRDPRMGALFIANGPSFKKGVVVAPFPNVDVYPLMARILGIKPEPNDGDPAEVAPILAAERLAR